MSSGDKLRELNALLDDLEQPDSNNKGRDLLVARRLENDGGIGDDDVEYEFERIKIDGDIGAELEGLVRDKVDNKVSALNNDTKRIAKYDIQNRHKDEDVIEYEPVENVPQFERFERLFEGQRFSSTRYTESPKPEFQAIRVSHENLDEPIIAFINYSRRQILGRTSWLRMKVGSETHRKVDESLLGIPNRLDAVYYDGTVFVFNHTKFENAFGYMDAYKENAEEMLTELQAGDIPFDDFQMFSEAVRGNPNALRLLQEVKERGVYEDMDVEDASLVREEFDTDLEFEEREDGTLAITMENKLDVWKVLRFFNDDHLNSPITEQGYVSLAKEDAGE